MKDIHIDQPLHTSISNPHLAQEKIPLKLYQSNFVHPKTYNAKICYSTAEFESFFLRLKELIAPENREMGDNGMWFAGMILALIFGINFWVFILWSLAMVSIIRRTLAVRRRRQEKIIKYLEEENANYWDGKRSKWSVDNQFRFLIFEYELVSNSNNSIISTEFNSVGTPDAGVVLDFSSNLKPKQYI